MRCGGTNIMAGQALVAALALAAGLAGCGGRDHSNPFDPANPDTQGEPGAARAEAGCARVDLTWSDLNIEDIRGFRLWRERLAPGPAGPALVTDEILPASARGYADQDVSNGAVYDYTVEFLFTPASSAFARPVRARPGPALPWVADPCGFGIAQLGPDGRSLRRRIEDGAAVLALDIDAETHRMYAAEIDAGVVLVAATTDGAPLDVLEARGASCLDWSPDLGVLAVGAFYEQSLRWLSATGNLIAAVALGGHPEDVALHDSATTWVALYEGKLLRASWEASGASRVEVVVDSLGRAVRVLDDPAVDGCWVADRAGGRVIYVGADGSCVQTDAGLLGEPLDLAPAARGGCWVADRAHGAIVRLGRDCDLLESRDGLGRVAGVCEDPHTGTLWVTVPEAGEIRRLDGDGERVRLTLDGCPHRIAGDWMGGCAR
jgi:hypothetical protein